MKSTRRFGTFLIASLLTFQAYAQLPSNRVRPGTMYHEGDTVRSPRLGLEARIPTGWEGVMPQESEIFLLMSNTLNGEIYAVANDGIDQAGQMKRWKEGMVLSEGLLLVPDGEITKRGDVICANGKVAGNKPNNSGKIYLEAKCSPFGYCVSYMLTSDPASFEK